MTDDHARQLPQTPYDPAVPVPLDKRGCPAVIWMARKQEVDQLHEWAALGYPVDCPDSQMNTALHWAVYNGCSSSIETLLALGANPNALNYKGQTPLHHAVWVARGDYLDQLVAAGALWDIADLEGNNPLARLGLPLPAGVQKTTPQQVEQLGARLGLELDEDLWHHVNPKGLTTLAVIEANEPKMSLPAGFARRLGASISARHLTQAMEQNLQGPVRATHRPRL